MKKPLAELLAKAAQTLPPQKPSRSSYKQYWPLIVQMRKAGHPETDISWFLVNEGEVKMEKQESCYRSIRDLISRNAPELLSHPKKPKPSRAA